MYLAGGRSRRYAGNSLLCLDLDHQAKGWQELKAMPGSPRVQPLVAASDGKLYVFGGFAGRTPKAEPTVSTDGLCYDQEKQWSAVPVHRARRQALALGGGAAATLPNGDILAIGGVNHDIFLAALIDQAPDYLSHPIEWYRFNPYTCVFNPKGHMDCGRGSRHRRAGASLVVVPSRKEAIVTGGELKPRIRIPRPTRLTF